MKLPRHLLPSACLAVALAGGAYATNPLITDQFTADPSARVFGDRIYVYPSHDIPPVPGKSRPDWFCMEDYHVFSSANLTDWQDHGVILTQTAVPWANPGAYAMWAPDCVFKNGKYYFYFPAAVKPMGFRIGVAVADQPTGPFKPEATPIEGVQGIDPCVFIDEDGAAYLYYSRGKIMVAKLKENMLQLDGPPKVIDNLPTKGLLEGPFVFKRNGVYYLTYPHVENKIERLEYATSDSPLGPFQPAGVILDESTSGCWTVHQSIVEFQGQWYLFYHDKDLSPAFDKNRSIRADLLAFGEEGKIRKVVPTLRGVGLVPAQSRIELDRYSAISDYDTTVSFLDAANPRDGWQITLASSSAWVRFNGVDCGPGGQKELDLRATAATGGVIEIILDRPDGPAVGRLAVARGTEWRTIPFNVQALPAGVHDLLVFHADGGPVSVDWLRFR